MGTVVGASLHVALVLCTVECVSVCWIVFFVLCCIPPSWMEFGVQECRCAQAFSYTGAGVRQEKVIKDESTLQERRHYTLLTAYWPKIKSEKRTVSSVQCLPKLSSWMEFSLSFSPCWTCSVYRGTSCVQTGTCFCLQDCLFV